MNNPASQPSKSFHYHSNLVGSIALCLRTTALASGLIETEEEMRRFILAAAASLAVMAAGTLAASHANAMTVSTPAGIRAAVDSTSLTQDVAYVCRRVWGYGSWRRSCYWTGPRYWGRPYWRARPYWRHRYWRRRWW
jgi:hypothetical protein